MNAQTTGEDQQMASTNVNVNSSHVESSIPQGSDIGDVATPTAGEQEVRKELFQDVPLQELRITDIINISTYLNSPGHLDGDCMNDYTGLAEKIGFSNFEIKKFERQKNITSALFDEWITIRKDLEPTLWNLWKHLTDINRVDILYDMKSAFGKSGLP